MSNSNNSISFKRSLFSVRYNSFIDNGDTCQVCDDGTSNIVSHNYYDDWDSPDVDVNGYVDSPYAFEGDSENQDEYPLAEAGVVPTEVEPTPTTGTGGNNPLPMELIIITGATGAIIIIAGILLLKRR